MREFILIFDVTYEPRLRFLPLSALGKNPSLDKFIDEIRAYSHKTCDNFLERDNAPLIDDLLYFACGSTSPSVPFVVVDQIDLR